MIAAVDLRSRRARSLLRKSTRGEKKGLEQTRTILPFEWLCRSSNERADMLPLEEQWRIVSSDHLFTWTDRPSGIAAPVRYSEIELISPSDPAQILLTRRSIPRRLRRLTLL